MTAFDLFLMAVIIAASLYVLYRSFWKKKGHCAGCESAGSCGAVNRVDCD